VEVSISSLARLIAVGLAIFGLLPAPPRAALATLDSLRERLSLFAAAYLTEGRVRLDPDAQFSPRERRSFLDHQFGTKAFSKAISIDEDFWERTDRHSILLGLIEVPFASCRDLAHAKAAVARADKEAFTLEVLTEFRTISRERTLIFALSESPFDGQVSRLFQNLTRFEPEKADCADGRSPRPPRRKGTH
jgi:hypothetical protein